PNHSVREPARALYDLLLKPAQAALQGKTNLILVPDDVLWELPFQALQPADNHFLLQDCILSYAPSLTVLREMRRLHDAHHSHLASLSAAPASPAPTLLALGNPALAQETRARAQFTRRGGHLVPLPQAEREVKTLGKLYGAAH